jgi:hypothetical protein
VLRFSSRSGAPASRPTAEDPPTSPPRLSTGACGGIAVGRLRAWLPFRSSGAQRRGRCDRAPGAAGAAKRPTSLSGRRLRGRRATKRSDWRGGRAGPSTCWNSVVRAARSEDYRVLNEGLDRLPNGEVAPGPQNKPSRGFASAAAARSLRAGLVQQTKPSRTRRQPGGRAHEHQRAPTPT